MVRIRWENVLELRWKPSAGGYEKGAAGGGVVPWLGLRDEPGAPELPTRWLIISVYWQLRVLR